MINFYHVDFEFQDHFVDIHAFFVHVTVWLAREDQSLNAPHNKSNEDSQERATHLTAPSLEIRKHLTTRNCPHLASQTPSAHTPSFDYSRLTFSAALSLCLDYRPAGGELPPLFSPAHSLDSTSPSATSASHLPERCHNLLHSLLSCVGHSLSLLTFSHSLTTSQVHLLQPAASSTHNLTSSVTPFTQTDTLQQPSPAKHLQSASQGASAASIDRHHSPPRHHHHRK